MSRSSGDRRCHRRGGCRPGVRRRRTGRRAQVEPLAALAAVLAVVVGLGLYAGALDDAAPRERERRLAPITVDGVADGASGPTGVLDPERLPAALDAAPDGRRVNATLTTDDGRWTAGPAPPVEATDRAARRVGVRPGDGTASSVELGRLRVILW